MKKKIITLLTAAALTVSMVMPAFAEAVTATAAEGSSEYTLAIEAQVVEPEIEVTITMADDTIKFNPYKLEVAAGVDDSLIISDATVVNNGESNVSVAFSGSVVNAPDSKVKVGTTAAAAEAATVPTVYVQATMLGGTDDTASKYVAAKGTTETAEAALAIVLKATATKPTVVPVLAKAGGVGESTLTVVLSGATGGNGWVADDKATINLSFDIQPSSAGATWTE